MDKFRLTLALGLLLPSLSFAGVDYGFSCVPVENKPNGNSGICSSLASQLKVNVGAATLGSPYDASFLFTNAVGTASSITQIYFDFPSSLSVVGSAVSTVNGPSFALNGAPPNLPGGNSIGFSSDLRYTANSPVSSSGINASGEQVLINVNFSGSPTLNSIYSALNNGTFRIGVHVQAIGTSGQSDSFVTHGNVVPEPSSYAAMLGMGIAALAWAKRRKK